MTILLYKDGRLVIDDGNPIEGNSLEGLVACVSDPQSGDTLKFDGKQWVAGAAASGLPAVTGDDNGKVLTVVEGEWAPASGGGGGGGGLLVTITIADGRKTMNKTAGEIVEALGAGVPVVCTIPDDEFTSYCHAQVVASEAETSSDGAGIEVINFWVPIGGYTEQYHCASLDDYPFLSM